MRWLSQALEQAVDSDSLSTGGVFTAVFMLHPQ